MLALSDVITDSIDIRASAQRVWDLVSEPGWFINNSALVPHELEDKGNGLTAVTDSTHGLFYFQTVELTPPSFAAFRWIQDPNDLESPSTLVEFTITEKQPGQVTLAVKESGFASLGKSDVELRAQIEGNTEGWKIELGLLKDAAEQ